MFTVKVKKGFAREAHKVQIHIVRKIQKYIFIKENNLLQTLSTIAHSLVVYSESLKGFARDTATYDKVQNIFF